MAKSKNETPGDNAPPPTSLGTEKKCGKCRLLKPLFDFGQNRQNPDGKHHHCKVCRSLYAQSPDARKKQRDAYKIRRESQKISYLEAQLETIQEPDGTPIQQGKYRLNSPLAMAKGKRTWEQFSEDIGTTRDTILKWQRHGAPNRFQTGASHALRELRAHYEQLVIDENSLEAEYFFAICKRDRWDI